MKSIICLVDFTSTAQIAINQAIALAQWKKASLIICHVVAKEEEVKDELLKNLHQYELQATSQGILVETLIGRGNLFKEVERIGADFKPDLMVIGTHGKVGLRQNLFGSNIYKMVRAVNTACLVVNDDTQIIEGGYKRILMPVAPHDDYFIKLKQSIAVLADEGTIFIFEIRKPGAAVSEKLLKNTEEAKSYLAEHRINFKYLEIGSRSRDPGYSQETLAYAVKEQMDLLSIMTRVSDENKKFGKIDKENAVLNKVALPILTCNA